MEKTNNEAPKKSNCGMKLEYELLRNEILATDHTCVIVLGFLLTVTATLVSIALKLDNPHVACMISPIWIIGYFYLSEKRFGIIKMAYYLRTQIEGHYIGLGWETWLDDTRKKQKKYLFSWDEIPGNDDKRIIEFLKDELKIEWAKTENISKIDDGKTIIVSNKEKSLSLKLNDKKTKVNLKIDDGRVYEFTVKTENGKLNIYQNKFLLRLDPYLLETLASLFVVSANTLVASYSIQGKFRDLSVWSLWIFEILLLVMISWALLVYIRKDKIYHL